MLNDFACTTAQYLARRDDPMTSKVAGQNVPEFIAGHEGAIYGAICDSGSYGATAKDIAKWVNYLRATDSDLPKLTDVQVNRRLGAMGKRSLIKRNCIGYVTNCNTGKVTEVYEQRDGCAVWRKK